MADDDCDCIHWARTYLACAQKLNELEGMDGHAFFTLGAALNMMINHVEGTHGVAPEDRGE